jgi:hypothetical protein
LVTVQSCPFWRKYRPGGRFLFRAFASGAMILALIGFSPESDVVAHVGGFIAGAILGCALGFVSSERWQNRPANAGAFLALFALLLTTWRQALKAP